MTALSRRTILQALGWSAVGLTAVATVGCGLPVLPPRNDPTAEDAAAWISLRPEGHFEIYSPRAEMGQGVDVGLCQIAAEELSIGPEQIRAVNPDTARIPVCRATVGSDSIRHYGPLMAQAAAALALAIRQQTAARLGVEVAAVSLDRTGAAAAGHARLPFAALATHPAIVIEDEHMQAAQPRGLAQGGKRRAIGRSQPVAQLRAMVTGDGPLYTDDIRLPGMLFGAAVRAASLGAQPEAIDDSGCRDVAGYVGLFRSGDFAGILAERRGALAVAMDRLTVRDSQVSAATEASIAAALDINAGLSAGNLEHDLADEGDIASDSFDIDLRLDTPLAAHASIEPRTAVARFGADGVLEVWTGTQDAFFVRKRLMAEFGLSESQVVVHGMRIGGAFGGRTLVAAELEAARLARLSGRPVKVQWSRRDEFRAGFHRQPSSHRIRASADANGRITHWWHAFRAGHVIFTSAAMGPGLQFATSFVADFGTARGALPPYAAANKRVEFEDVRLPVPTGAWRGLGAGPNCWAVETAIDALARQRGQDPVAFRLANMGAQHPRLAAVLTRAAEMAGWTATSDRASRGSALGIACGIYKEMSYAAAVAQVEKTAEGYRVSRFWCAQDCGLVINPDRVRAQVEGNLVWSIAMAFSDRLTVADGRIVAADFFDYALPRFAEVPEMEIELVEGAPEPTGAAETAMVCGTAAITNAIARLNGAPVLSLPVET